MCLIVINPEGKDIPHDLIEAAHINNSDGFGLMRLGRKNRIVTAKVMPNSAQDCIDLYEKHKGVPIALHFRLATVGSKNKEMCHPFQVLNYKEHGRDVYFMHNGPRLDVPILDNTKSDTWHMADLVLKPILAANPDIIKEPEFLKILENLGDTERMALLDGSEQDFFYANFAKSDVVNGLILSNTYSLRRGVGHNYNPKTGKVSNVYSGVYRGFYDDDDYYSGVYGGHCSVSSKSAADSASVFSKPDDLPSLEEVVAGIADVNAASDNPDEILEIQLNELLVDIQSLKEWEKEFLIKPQEDAEEEKKAEEVEKKPATFPGIHNSCLPNHEAYHPLAEVTIDYVGKCTELELRNLLMTNPDGTIDLLEDLTFTKVNN